VGALFLYYGQFDINLSPWALDDLAQVLEDNRIPLFLCPNDELVPKHEGVDSTDWNAVVDLCQSFPALPVVVMEDRIYWGQRSLYQALAACPNLHVDLSCVWLHRAVEFISREFGAERLVWTSQLPERSPGPSLMQLNYADLTPEEHALIAGGNLRRLLSWQESIPAEAPAVTFSPPVDEFHRRARARESFRGEGFADSHGHLGGATSRHVVWDTPEELVAEMDKLGVDLVCVFSLEGVFGDEGYGNDRVVETIAQFPDRFVGYTLVNPNHGEEQMIAEMEKGRARGLQGVKLISYQGYPKEGPLIDVACAFAHEHHQLIINHDWGTAEQLRRLCLTYHQACFFTGHSVTPYATGAPEGYEAVVAEVDNLYISTCPLHEWGHTEDHVARFGADRLVFASDLTDLPIAWGLAPILYAPIPLEEKRLILGGNLRRVLDEYGIKPGLPALSGEAGTARES
jgi:predicted TIM-barrel fold metal-dependent hydrolase